MPLLLTERRTEGLFFAPLGLPELLAAGAEAEMLPLRLLLELPAPPLPLLGLLLQLFPPEL